MAKNLKWAEGSVSRVRKAVTTPKLVWLREGELANLVVVERVGNGSRYQRASTRTRILGTVMVLKVWGQDSHGYCEVLLDGHPQRVHNAQLRPIKE